jgi:hypothetical protein
MLGIESLLRLSCQAVVYEPSFCTVAQGAKEVILEGDAYRYDPARSLLVSVDLPVSARVVEASLSRPCLMVRVSLDPTVVGDLLADSTTISPPSRPERGLGVTPVEPPLLDAVARLVSLLDSPQDVGPLSPQPASYSGFQCLGSLAGFRFAATRFGSTPRGRCDRDVIDARNALGANRSASSL